MEVVNILKFAFLGNLAAETVMLRKIDFLFRKDPDLPMTHFSQSKYPDPALQIKKSKFESKIFHLRNEENFFCFMEVLEKKNLITLLYEMKKNLFIHYNLI